MGHECGREEGRKTIGQIAQTCKRQQCAQDTREEDRPEKKLTDHDAMKAEEHQGDVKADSMQPDESHRECPQLIGIERG